MIDGGGSRVGVVVPRADLVPTPPDGPTGWVVAPRRPARSTGRRQDEDPGAVSVSVVVAVRDVAGHVLADLAPVLDALPDDGELVVVDDGSRDGTAGVLAAHPDPRIGLARCRSPHGWAWAMDLGLQQARGVAVTLASGTAVAAGVDDHLRRLADPGVLAVRTLRAGRLVALTGWRTALVGRLGGLAPDRPDPMADLDERLADRCVPAAIATITDSTHPDVAAENVGARHAHHSDRPVGFPGVTDPVVATLASIPSRREQLARVVADVLPQVDRLCVYLNGYPDVPGFLDHPRVVVVRSQDHGDLRDNGKFHFVDEVADGYHVTLDDDMLYPPDHVVRLLAKIEQYDRRAVVGMHGIVVREPVTTYFDPAARTVRMFQRALRSDEQVHLLGTGTVAFHTSTLAVGPTDFPSTGMADIWLAVAAQRAAVPMVAVARPPGQLRAAEVTGPTLFEEFRDDDQRQVAAIAEVAPLQTPALFADEPTHLPVPRPPPDVPGG